MASLQDELTKVLPQMKLENLKFDDEVGLTTDNARVEVTSKLPITQQLWHAVKKTPGINTRRLEAMFPGQGGNVSTRLSQMLKGGKLTREPSIRGHAWYAVGDTFPMFRNQGRPKGSKNTYHSQPKTEITQSIETMNVGQARALYLELHKIFGAVK